MTDTVVGDALALDDELLEIEARGLGRQTWDRFRKHPVALISLIALAIMAIAFFLGPTLSPFEFDQIATGLPDEAPSFTHPFGTDQIGRDLMVRVFKGGQYSMIIAITVALVTTTLGTVIGAISGYFGKWIDVIISQLINLFFIIPIFVVLLVISVKVGGGVLITSMIIAALSWPSIARVVRGLFVQYKEREFVQAAIAAGAGPTRIMFRHIFPNCFGPIIVNATLLVGAAIVLESTLSFLGLGVRPPIPTLGNIVEEYKGAIDSDPSKVLLPGLFVVGISLCTNFLGDAMRDALDPTSRRSR